MARPRSPRHTPARLLTVAVLWAAARPANAAATQKREPVKTGRPPANQTIDIGNVGEKARVDIRPLSPDRPAPGAEPATPTT